jgi:hypothetical protein
MGHFFSLLFKRPREATGSAAVAGADADASVPTSGTGGRSPPEFAPPFRGPAADARLGELLLDALPLVAASGFAAEVSQHLALCGTTWRLGDRGATNDMLVQSLRLQCGAREAREAAREDATISDEDDYETTHERTTQLMRATMVDDLPRVLQLIQLGAPLDLVNEEWGFSALLWACYLGHERIVKALLDGKYEGMGASLIVSDEHREAPLHHASRGHVAIVRLLVARGADVAAESERSGSPLHVAVEGHHVDVVKALCISESKLEAFGVRDADDFTPLGLAINLGYEDCEAVLRAHGAKEV